MNMAILSEEAYDNINYSIDIPDKFNETDMGKRDFETFGDNLKDKEFISKYDDFETIDWQRDLARDRDRRRALRSRKGGLSYALHHFQSQNIGAQEPKIHFNHTKGPFGGRVFHSIGNFFSTILITHDAWSGWLCLLLVGLSAGIFAGFIDIGSSWLMDLKLGMCKDAFWFNREQCCWSSNDTTFDEEGCAQWHTWPEVFGYYKHNALSYLIKYFIYIVWALMFSAMSISLVKMFAPYACGSGMPEIKTILSGFIIRGYLGKWTLIIKTVTIMLAVSSGLTLGKEGPMVHIACCIGNICSYLFPKYGKNEAKKREILSAAAAAGVSVAFGAPIGGVLFSLEEISYYFPMKTLWRSFFCALVAAFVLRSINPFGNDHLVSYYVDYDKPWFMFELVPFILLGVFGGIVGAFFIRANYFWCKYRKTSILGKYTITEVLTVTLITAFICFPNPFTRESMNDLISQLYQDCNPANQFELCNTANNSLGRNLWKILIAMLFRTILLVFTFGMKIPAGLFIPSLAIGACAGRIFGIGMQQLVLKHNDIFIFKDVCKAENSCITPGLYAMVGSAAVLGGITRMTISLVVIMFEVTGGSQYIVPLMAAIMTAKWVGDALCKEGIYEAHIHLNNYPFLDYKEEEYPITKIAGEVMSPRRNDPPLISLTQNSTSVEEAEKMIKSYDFNGYPVIVSKESHYLVGYVVRKDLSLALTEATRSQHGLSPHSIIQFRVTDPSNQDLMNQNETSQVTGRKRASLGMTAFQDHFINSAAAPNYRGNNDNPTNIPTSYDESAGYSSSHIKLNKIIDLSPITVTDQTPMETVIEMFKKLGLRQVLVTHNGRLLGIITKKDILVHLKQISRMEKQPLLDEC